MADMTHANRARKYLENRSETLETVSVDSTLAVATATRESATEIRNGVRNIENRLHDISSALEADAGLVGFTRICQIDADKRSIDQLWINPRQVVAVSPSGEGKTWVHLTDGRHFILDGELHSIAMKLGVSA